MTYNWFDDKCNWHPDNNLSLLDLLKGFKIRKTTKNYSRMGFRKILKQVITRKIWENKNTCSFVHLHSTAHCLLCFPKAAINLNRRSIFFPSLTLVIRYLTRSGIEGGISSIFRKKETRWEKVMRRRRRRKWRKDVASLSLKRSRCFPCSSFLSIFFSTLGIILCNIIEYTRTTIFYHERKRFSFNCSSMSCFW